MSDEKILNKWAYKNGFTKVDGGFVNSQQKFFARWEVRDLKNINRLNK